MNFQSLINLFHVCTSLSVYVAKIVTSPSLAFPHPSPSSPHLSTLPITSHTCLLPSKLLLWDTLSAGYTISPSSNHPESYSMNNGGLVPSSSPSRQTAESMLYDTLIPKKQTVSTKYDSFRNQPFCQST